METEFFDKIPSLYSKGNALMYLLLFCFASIAIYSDESAFLLIPGYIIGSFYVFRTKNFVDENVVLGIKNGETLGLITFDRILGYLSILFGLVILFCGGFFLISGIGDMNPFLLIVGIINFWWGIYLSIYSIYTLSLLKTVQKM